MHGWDLDSYANARRGLRLARDRDRRARRRGHRPRLRGGGRDDRHPTVIVAKTIKGKGVKEVENKDGFHGKALAGARAGDRGARRHPQHHGRGRQAGDPGRAARVRDRLARAADYELGGEVATRKAYGDALKAIGDARGDVVALDGEVSNSTYAEIFPERTPSGTSRCSSPSSRWSRPRSGCRCASGSPSPRPSRPSSRARTTSSAWRRSAGRTSSSAARTRASRSARTARRRWRSRISPCFRAVHGSTVLYPSDANQTAKLVEAMVDLDGIVFLRTTRAENAGHLRRRRGLPGRRRQGRALLGRRRGRR